MTAGEQLKWSGRVERQVEKCIEALETKGCLRAINFSVNAGGPKYKVTVTRMVTIEVDWEGIDDDSERTPTGD